MKLALKIFTLKSLFFSLIAIIIIFPLIDVAHSENNTLLNQKIMESYISSDYKTVAELLEQQIKETTSESEKVNFLDLYRKHLLLAYIYSWKLNKTDEALKQYQKSTEVRLSSNAVKKLLPIEFLYIAEIYEGRKDFSRAREYYQNLLKELIAAQEQENDDVVIIMNDELIRFVKYQIDGIDLKNHPQEKFKPLLPELKFTSSLTALPALQILTMALIPTAEYDLTIAMKKDIVGYIKQSQTNLSSIILNYSLILNASASSVTESSEKAMEVYISKYSESYFSLSLGHVFYRFYKENGQDEKAKKLQKDLYKIAEKRGIKLITAPEKRFSSPEETWNVYRKALIEGDIDTAMECYILGRKGPKKAFSFSNKGKTRGIGEKMGDIERITGNEQNAKYRIKRVENGKESTYYIYFYNIDGEWKMAEF